MEPAKILCLLFWPRKCCRVLDYSCLKLLNNGQCKENFSNLRCGTENKVRKFFTNVFEIVLKFRSRIKVATRVSNTFLILSSFFFSRNSSFSPKEHLCEQVGCKPWNMRCSYFSHRALQDRPLHKPLWHLTRNS